MTGPGLAKWREAHDASPNPPATAWRGLPGERLDTVGLRGGGDRRPPNRTGISRRLCDARAVLSPAKCGGRAGRCGGFAAAALRKKRATSFNGSVSVPAI